MNTAVICCPPPPDELFMFIVEEGRLDDDPVVVGTLPVHGFAGNPREGAAMTGLRSVNSFYEYSGEGG